jgi:hypothetical protein
MLLLLWLLLLLLLLPSLLVELLPVGRKRCTRPIELDPASSWQSSWGWFWRGTWRQMRRGEMVKMRMSR